MSRRRKNTFSKAINHIKSKKFDMIEAAPTNSTSGFMTVTPNAPNPDYVPANYPSPSDQPDFSVGAYPENNDEARDTTGLFKEDGTLRTALPPITESSPDRSYILGPMAAMYYGWWSGGTTTIGYIRQSDRKMVNLGTISGKLSDWDGEGGFTSYGQLTLEQTVWFKNVAKAPGQTNDPATANYRAFYPGPPSNSPDSSGRYYCTITGQPKDDYRPPEGDPYIPSVQGPMNPDDNFAAWWERLKEKTKEDIWDWLKKLRIGQPGTDKMPLDFENRLKQSGYDPNDLLSYLNMNNVNVASNTSYPTPWPKGPYYGGEEQKKKDWIKKELDRLDQFLQGPGGKFKVKNNNKNNKNNNTTQVAHYEPQGKVLSESKRSILKNIKKPVVIPETKQKKYKVKLKIRGIENSSTVSKPVETPKEYKKIGGRNLWGQYEYQQNMKQSQERKNQVLELVGEGEHAFRYMLTNSKKLNAQEMEKFWGLNPEMHSHFYNGKKYKVTRKEQLDGDYLVFLIDENGFKSNILQSELNEKLAEEDQKRFIEEYNKINSKPKRNDRISYEKDPLFKKVSKRLKKEIDYPDKPAKMGYPNDPPPKMVNGWHPEYGKRYKYDKLDPVSAVMMKRAPTGNPEVDANVSKAAKKPK